MKKNYAVKEVFFDANNGENIKTNIIKNSKVKEPKDPIKNGYKFLGWYTQLRGGEKWNFKKDKAYGNMKLYAHWQKIEEHYFISPKTGKSSIIFACILNFALALVTISVMKIKKI
jgi:uncharacterized repeat protein (TIGR02543 family)